MRLASLIASALLLVAAPAASAQLLDSVGQTLDTTVDQVTEPLPQALQDPVDNTVDTLRETVEGVAEPAPPPVGGSPPAGNQTPDPSPQSSDRSSQAPSPQSRDSSPQTPGSQASDPTPQTSGGGSSTRGSAGDADDDAATPVSSSSGGDEPGDARPAASGAEPVSERADDSGGGVTGAIREVVEVVPGPLKAALAVLGFLVLLLGAGYLLTHRRARWLRRQREKLLDEVGVLQQALLPDVPARIGPVSASVAYRPADGPGAGGDFYDAFELSGGKVAVLVGDVSGHGREALARTTLMRYTLRAYLDAGLEPKAALHIAGRTLESDLDGDFATVVVATFDPGSGTLTYACAGHPPPLICGPAEHEPITASSSPPIGVGATTGLRQTRVGMTDGSYAAFFTDGLLEARIGETLLGRERLAELMRELGCNVGAAELLARVRAEADRVSDDMAACVIRPEQGLADAASRVEELEVEPADLAGAGRTFLEACGVPVAEVDEALAAARAAATNSGRALVRVRITDGKPVVESSPVSPESLEASAAGAS